MVGNSPEHLDMFGKARLRNGTVQRVTEAIRVSRAIKSEIFDKDLDDIRPILSGLEATSKNPDVPYNGPRAENLKSCGLLDENGKIAPLVGDVLASLRKQDGSYFYNDDYSVFAESTSSSKGWSR